MISLRMRRLVVSFAILLVAVAVASADPANAISSVRHEGIMVTSLAQPQFFIFQSGSHEEHFDGSTQSMQAQGGMEKGEPISGLHYLVAHPTVNGSPWSAADGKLVQGQFHGGSTGDFYLFKTVEGQLFYLPREGETPVVRIDFRLRDGRTVTVWTRK
jgi:hypothetical protein